jgi:streptomycin 3"-adenylyltransferase
MTSPAAEDAAVRSTIEALRELVSTNAPGVPLGLYLTGSYCEGGLRPDSDVDLLLITREPLGVDERRPLVEHLLGFSGRRATVRPGRPIELTSLAIDDIVPWRYPATRDFLYGEWLRTDYEAGRLPVREADPNLPVLLTAARTRSVALLGPPLADLAEPVPPEHLAESMLDALPDLLDNLVGDERNVLLTLARIVFTLRTGAVVPKDVAAAEVGPTLDDAHARLLDLAARAYRGEVRDDWGELADEAAATAEALTERIRR